MTEAYTSLPNNLRYYGQVENGKVVRYGSQIPFNFDMITRTNKDTKAPEFKEHILSWIEGMPKARGIQANWVVSGICLNLLFCSSDFGISIRNIKKM